jgi:hypothetical protein
MSRLRRLMVGFVAGFLSVLIFTNGLIAILHSAGIVPSTPWNMMAVPPFGIPRVISDGFWGGLWGILYALLEPRLTARLGWWLGGAIFGILGPLMVNWFVVSPLKGMPVAAGFAPSLLLLGLVFGGVFGFGVATIFRGGTYLLRGQRARIPAAGMTK